MSKTKEPSLRLLKRYFPWLLLLGAVILMICSISLTHKKQEQRILIGAYSSLTECITSLNRALADGGAEQTPTHLIRAYSALVRLDGILWTGTFLVDSSIDATSPQGLGGFSKIASEIILADAETITFELDNATYIEQLVNLSKALTHLKDTIASQDGQLNDTAKLSSFIKNMHVFLDSWNANGNGTN